MAIKRKIILEADVKDATTKIDTLGKSIENVDDAAISSKVGFDVMKEGVLGVGLALKALGIGLIVSAFVALKNLFGQNQMAMDLFTTATESLKVVFNKIVELATKVGSTLSSAFSDPKQAIADLWEALKKNIVNRFEGFIDQWKAVGKVIKGVFDLDWDTVTKGATEFGQALIQTATGFDTEQQQNIIDGVKSLGKEIATTTKEASAYGKAITKMRNEVKLAEAQQRLLQMQYQKDAELQRQLRDDISLTIDERIDANTKLGEILDEQFAKEKELADKKLELAEKELSVNKDNIDLQVALINAKTELADLEERITGQRSEQLVNLTGLEKERQDALKETEKVAKDTGKAEVKIAELTAANKRDIIAGALGNVATLMGEESKAGKALAVAQALINTYSAATTALSSPAQGGAGPIWGIPVAIGAVAAGMSNVRKILSTKLPGGDDGGGGGGGGAPDIPKATGIGGNLIPNLEAIEPTELGGATPVQAYVVENDISDAQALQEELDIQATL